MKQKRKQENLEQEIQTGPSPVPYIYEVVSLGRLEVPMYLFGSEGDQQQL